MPSPYGRQRPWRQVTSSGSLVDVGEELGAQAALAHPGLAHDRDELAGALLARALEGPDQERLLQRAPDQRGRVRAGRRPTPKRARACERTPERERLGLALDRRPARAPRSRTRARSAGRSARRRRPAHRGGALQARGGVDHVAGNDPLARLRAGAERDHRLARVDPDPDLQREARVVLVQLLDRLEDAQRGPDRTLGVVLVRNRSAEHGHDRVADELLDRAAVALDLLSQALVVRTDAGADVLGVGGLGGGGEADQVAEEDGDDLALLGRQGEVPPSAKRRRTGRTETGPGAPCRRTGRSSPTESRAATENGGPMVSRLGLLHSTRRSRCSLEPERILDRESLPVVVEVGEHLDPGSPGGNPAASTPRARVSE